MDKDDGWSVVATKKLPTGDKQRPKSEGRGTGGRGRGRFDKKGTPTKKPPSPLNSHKPFPKESPSQPTRTPSKAVDILVSNENKASLDGTEETRVDELAKDLSSIQLEAPTPPPATPAPAPKAWSSGNKLKFDTEEEPVEREVQSVQARPPSVTEALPFLQLARSFHPTPNVADHKAKQYFVRGLVNLNNACFRNSIVQAMLSLPPFVRLLDYLQDSLSDHHSLLLYPSWSELLTFYRIFSTPPSNISLSVTLAPLILPKSQAVSAETYLTSLCASFQRLVEGETAASTSSWGWSGKKASKAAQQDACEFFTFLLDCLHEELLKHSSPLCPAAPYQPSSFPSAASELKEQRTDERVGREQEEGEGGWVTVSHTPLTKKSPPISTLNHIPKHYKVETDLTSKEKYYSSLSSTPISLLFYGCLRSTVLYPPRQSASITFQRFHTLTLSLPTPASAQTSVVEVENLLLSYFQIENLGGEGEGGREGVRKVVTLEALPPILVLQIARFAFDLQTCLPTKIHTAVEYSEELSLPGHILSPTLTLTCPPRYRLHALVLHHGKKATGGHYSAYICGGGDGEGGWVHVNDTKCFPLAGPGGAQQLVYLLFYVRIA